MTIFHVVHIVDDDDSFRKAIGRLLEASDFKVILYKSAFEFLDANIDDHPGCILLDVHMPNMSGLDLQCLLKDRLNILPIIFITGAASIPMSVSAIKNGAIDFISKPVEIEKLLSLIKKSFSEYESQSTYIRARRMHIQNLNTLTHREKEVLDLLITGMLNKQIGWVLGTTERTIKAHRKQIMDKMKVKSLAELVAAMTKF